MQLLITGATGLLGGNLSYLFNEHGYNVTGTFNKSRVYIPGVNMIDASDLEKLENKVDCIIHCAAKTNVDECEKNPAEAYESNVLLTSQMCDIANKMDALLIYVSTDAVYKDSETKKTEQSAIEPLSVYAQTKLEAEQIVSAKVRRYYIIRTNIFGFNILDKNSLAEWVLAYLNAGKAINGFYDVFFSPILVNDLVDVFIAFLLDGAPLVNSVVNVGSSTSMSKYEFAYGIAERFKLDTKLIRRTSVHNFGFTAKRMMNSVMDSSMFQKQFDHQLLSLEEYLDKFKFLSDEGYPLKLKSFNNYYNYANR